MKLSAPIYHLKRGAKQLARQRAIPLHEALDLTAAEQGFASWSLLAARHAAQSAAARVYEGLEPGDLVLLAARPGQGKTLLALELAAQAVRSGNRSFFFTLDYTPNDVVQRLHSIAFEPARFESLFAVDCSNQICAAYIVEALQAAGPGTLVVIDYLQLLDQNRAHPPLADQVSALKAFARERELVIVFISQIDRSYDPSSKPYPDRGDVRLPNPLDLGLFSKMCFLNGGAVQVHATGGLA
ncbi:MAG: helicase [Devosia sp.]|nr:helicase [Devosia sp.]